MMYVNKKLFNLKRKEMLEKVKKAGIPIISAEQSRILWPSGDTRYDDVFHFKEDKLEKVKKDSDACVIYINPLSLIEQQKIRGFAYRDNGYTFFRSSIWSDKNIFNYFREEFKETPSPGYYLFYNMKGLVESEARKLSVEDFYPASLAIASQAMFNFKHFLFEAKPGESYFGISYHVAKYYKEEGLGLGIGSFAVDFLKIIYFKEKTASFQKKIILH